MDKRAIAIPDNFDADAEQHKRGQPHQHVGAVLAERADGTHGKSVTQVNGRGVRAPRRR